LPRIVRGEPSWKPLLVLLGYFIWATALPVRSRRPLCPFRIVTGRDCPLCGLTRSTHELSRGRIRAALEFNPIAPLLWLGGLVWAGGFKLEASPRGCRGREAFPSAAHHAPSVRS
jgi:hypothetical protein